MKAIIDRLEGNLAILEYEDGSIQEIDINRLPKGSREGDCLLIESGVISIDSEETEKRYNKIKKLMNDLYN